MNDKQTAVEWISELRENGTWPCEREHARDLLGLVEALQTWRDQRSDNNSENYAAVKSALAKVEGRE